MRELHHNTLLGVSKTTWRRHGSLLSISVFRDYDQPWHVISPQNYTLRIRGPVHQYFFWIRRGCA